MGPSLYRKIAMSVALFVYFLICIYNRYIAIECIYIIYLMYLALKDSLEYDFKMIELNIVLVLGVLTGCVMYGISKIILPILVFIVLLAVHHFISKDEQPVIGGADVYVISSVAAVCTLKEFFWFLLIASTMFSLMFIYDIIREPEKREGYIKPLIPHLFYSIIAVRVVSICNELLV